MTLRLQAADRDALVELLHETLGQRARPDSIRVLDHDGEYRVLRAELREPERAVVVKLCPPGDPRGAGFERAAAIARLVRAQTDVPTFEPLAVDASGGRCPWAYLVTSEVEGTPWRAVAATLEPDERRQLHEQLGRAAAGLHSVRFQGYGEIGPDGVVAPAPSYLDALAAWATARIANPEHAELFLRLLGERAELFADVGPAQLTHEDLNPNNLLVRREGDTWRLAGVLDFDKAWAGCGESDLARLALWRGMTGPGFWEGYISRLPVPPGYPDRRPLYQLLWCLEYARPTPEHNADTRAVCETLGIPPVVFTRRGTTR